MSSVFCDAVDQLVVGAGVSFCNVNLYLRFNLLRIHLVRYLHAPNVRELHAHVVNDGRPIY
jgi:hypothetical protein